MASKRRSNGQGTLFQRVTGGPWVAAWYDHTGRRRIRSTRTTDRRTAERLLAKDVADTALRRDGVVDPRQDRFCEANRVPLADHFAAYCTHCRQSGQAEKHVQEKERHLKSLLHGTGVTRLSELTAETLEKHMWAMKAAGKAARTLNFARQIAVAFMNWCKNTNRIEVNPLTVVARQDERQDRRRIRRPLNDDEMAALLAVAEPRGRKAWYLAAALVGLRRGDLKRLRWADVDFTAGTITICDGKSRRTDIIPVHPQLAEELARRLEGHPALPQAKVFPTVVTDVTRLKDFLRAGIARREVVTDAEGKPVMIGKGKRQRPTTKIVTEDAEGRVVDLHAMRTTLGTNLARAGVAPQIAQRIMRHGDYRTTLKHYTVLGLVDTAKAINALPSIRTPQADALAATGTAGRDDPVTVNRHTVTRTPHTVTALKERHVKGLRFERDGSDGCDGLAPTLEERNALTSLPGTSSRSDGKTPPMLCSSNQPRSRASYSDSSGGAERCETVRRGATDKVSDCPSAGTHNPLASAALCDSMRDGATPCRKACGRNSVAECQLPKLDVEGSNPFARCSCQGVSGRDSRSLPATAFPNPQPVKALRASLRSCPVVPISDNRVIPRLWWTAVWHQDGHLSEKRAPSGSPAAAYVSSPDWGV